MHKSPFESDSPVTSPPMTAEGTYSTSITITTSPNKDIPNTSTSTTGIITSKPEPPPGKNLQKQRKNTNHRKSNTYIRWH